MTSSHSDYYRRLLETADIGEVADRLMPDRRTGTSGDEVTYDCPRHSSKSRRSLTVSPAKGLWHCWGCDVGGDALHLVEFVKHGIVTKGHSGRMPQSHRDARDEVAGIVGMPTLSKLGLTDEQRAELEARHQEREQVLDALTQIADLYHEELLANDEVLGWLERKYGFGREQVVEFKVGYAGDPRAGIRLQEQGVSTELLVKTGAFVLRRGWPRSFFNGRVVFPYFNRGRVAYLIGRQTPWTPDQRWEKGKYKKLPVHDPEKRPYVSKAIDNSVLWGEDCLRARPDVLLITEGITDAMESTAAGIPTISPVTTRLKKADFERVIPQLRRIRRVIVVMDNELSSIGGEAAMELAEHLRAEGVAAFVAELPLQEAQETARAAFAELLGEEALEQFKAAPSRGRGKFLEKVLEGRPEELERARELREAAKIDVAEWFRGGGTPDEFKKLLDEARTPVEIRVDRLEEGADLDAVREVLEHVARLSPLDREDLLSRIKTRTRRSLKALRDEIAPEAKATDKARAKAPADEGEDPGPMYESSPQGLVWNRRTADGVVPVPLTNFPVEITATVIEDDGQETTTSLELEATVAGRKKRFGVLGRLFNLMHWVVEQLGAKAVLYAGASIRDHARVAIQILSADAPVKHVCIHTGWRKHEEVGWCYVHAGGSIGPKGPVPGVETSLKGALERYRLPEPPEGEELLAAGRATLDLLDLGPDRILLVLLAATVRAGLSGTDITLHLAGESGTYKTSTAQLFQAFWGADLATGGLPGSWSSTGNSLEALAFLAKDALLVVDDFCPTGSASDVQRYHKEADRLIRAQGNRSGRGRLSSEGNLRKTKFPRGTIVSTGEDIPVGHSLRARMFVIEFAEGDIPKAKLTERQRQAASGAYARLMSAFLCWAAGRLDKILAWLPEQVQELRDRAASEAAHSRTPTTVAELTAGFEVFLKFAESKEILDTEQAEALRQRCWRALGLVAASQTEHLGSSEPTTLFFRLLASAIASGEAHVAGADGGTPPHAAALGWREHEVGSGDGVRLVYREQGSRVGWFREDDLYLDLTAAFKAAQRMASDTERLSVTARTLAKRLATRGLLKSTEPSQDKHTVRVWLEGARRRVIHVDASLLLGRVQRVPRGPSGSGGTGEAGRGPDAGTRNGHGGADSGPGLGSRDAAQGAQEATDGPAGPIGPDAGGDGGPSVGAGGSAAGVGRGERTWEG